MHKLESNALFRELKYSKQAVVVINISKYEGNTSTSSMMLFVQADPSLIVLSQMLDVPKVLQLSSIQGFQVV